MEKSLATAGNQKIVRASEANISLKRGTAVGTLLSFVLDLHLEDILKTVLLAVIGTFVSFTATLILKVITKVRKNNPVLIGNLFRL